MTKKDLRTRLVMVTNPFPTGNQMTSDVITLHLENNHRADGSVVEDICIRADQDTWTFICWMMDSVGWNIGSLPTDPKYTSVMDDDTFVIAKILG